MGCQLLGRKESPTKVRASVLSHVLSAIESNRTPGYHFAGHFLGLKFGPSENGTAVVTLDGGDHCLGSDGQIDLTSCFVLADIAMARGVRTRLLEAVPLVTVHIHLQFNGLPRRSPLVATGASQGEIFDTTGRQALATVSVQSGDKQVCFGSAAFIPLPAREGFSLPLPSAKAVGDCQIAREDLSAPELEILKRAESALEIDRDDDRAFIERFWDFRTRKTVEGGSATLDNGPHTSNRIGQAQGGLLLGLTTYAAFAALPGKWRLSALSGSFISPGEHGELKAIAQIVHKGSRTATVRSSVTGNAGRVVLESLMTCVSRE